jgi:transglutaminase-like putative cysteine protease
VLVSRSEMLVRAKVGGKQVERRQEEERVYEARPAGPLLSFRTGWRGDGGDRTLVGSCARAVCRVVEEAGGARSERVIEGVTETAELADAARLAAARRGTVRGRQLDTEKLRVKEVVAEFRGRDVVSGAGVSEEVSLVSESEPGDRLAAEYKVSDDGRIVEMRMGEAIVALPEPAEKAQRLDEVDLFALARVPLPRELPRTVPATAVYTLQGLPPAFHRNDARQRFQRAKGGATVLTVTARTPVAADAAKDTPLARARAGADADDLAPTPQFDFAAPEVARLAQDVTAGSMGTYEAARKLLDEVHRRLGKVYGASRDRASDVLAAGQGDCTEHAVLFVALARAAGIPARAQLGLVAATYADGQPALYWHAWAEVRSAGEWIAMDPIFGQPVADATHVGFGEYLGRGQADAVGLLGALKVVSVELKPPK